MKDSKIPRSKSAHDYQLLIKQILFCPIVYNPNQEIVYRDIMRYTYRDFRKRVCKLANMLTRLGVEPGDTVAVMDYDSHRYLECFFAVPMIGAVLHTVNTRLSPEQVLYTIDHAEDDVLMVHADYVPMMEQIRGRLDMVKQFILLKDDEKKPESIIDFAGEYEELIAKEAEEFDFPDFDENTRATTFYTTGTTGLPKGVYFSHRQLVMHTLSAGFTFSSAGVQGRFHRDDVYMPITPMFHVHAWGFPYMATSLGVKQVYPGRYAPEVLLELIAKEKVTFSHCVPTIMHMLLKHPNSKQVDLSNWKAIIGGSALSKVLCLEALERGIDVFTGYGLSETCPILSLAQLDTSMLSGTPEQQAFYRCKTGRALPMVEAKVSGNDSKELPWDGQSAGEILVRTPWLTQGYLKDSNNSEKLWRGGYLHTGDVAHRDELGYIKITDRLKDVIKIGGEWVSSLELEDIISHHPLVSEVAVVGHPDEKWGERPLALIVLKSNQDFKVAEKDIQHRVREYADKGVIAKQVVLLKIKFIEALDKTGVGKINKVELRRKYATN